MKFRARLSATLRNLPWLTRRRQGSLVMRLLLLGCFWGVAVYLLAVAGLWWTSERLIRDNVDRQALQWLAKLDELGTPLLVSGDASYFAPIREHVASFPEVASLAYYAGDGALLARYAAPASAAHRFPPPTPDELSALAAAPTPSGRRPHHLPDSLLVRITAPVLIRSIPNDGMLNVDLERPVQEKTRQIGSIDLVLDMHAYHDTLERNILYGSGLILLLFALAALVGRYVILRALRPLAELQAPLARLAQGETDIEVASEGASEIAAIGQALNTTIAALRDRDRELKRLAVFDTLTGLYNRHSFNHALEREKARAALDGHGSALLFIDLDHFKEVNDTAGHAAGDDLLIQVGQLLKRTVRSDDIVARLGGDEFTIILKDTPEDDAARVAGEVCSALGNFVFTVAEHAFRVQCSIGIAMIDAEQVLPSVVLSRADTACHEAKTLGRNSFVPYSAIAGADVLHLQQTGIREQIVQSLVRNDFTLVYLPVVELHSNRLRYFDSSVRMHSTAGEIPAGAFLAAAERFELIQQVDRQVVLMALRQLAALADPQLLLAIKLSARSLQQPEMLDYLRDNLARSGILPAQLMVAISERAILDSVTQARNFITGLRDLGCRVAIDDFGVSLNALSLLDGLPVQQLCIEGNLANSLCASSFNHALLVSIVGIARELGIETLAKQVFREEEASELRRIGIDLLQGPLLGYPRRAPRPDAEEDHASHC